MMEIDIILTLSFIFILSAFFKTFKLFILGTISVFYEYTEGKTKLKQYLDTLFINKTKLKLEIETIIFLTILAILNVYLISYLFINIRLFFSVYHTNLIVSIILFVSIIPILTLLANGNHWVHNKSLNTKSFALQGNINDIKNLIKSTNFKNKYYISAEDDNTLVFKSNYVYNEIQYFFPIYLSEGSNNTTIISIGIENVITGLPFLKSETSRLDTFKTTLIHNNDLYLENKKVLLQN